MKDQIDELTISFGAIYAKIEALKATLNADQLKTYQQYLEKKKQELFQKAPDLSEQQKQFVDKLFQ